MNLHTDTERFSTLIHFTAEHFRISPAFIEKDYWITRALQRMSHNPNAEKVVFKGGTSLSKAYRLTDRFSEDIDIAVIEADSFSGNRLKMLIKRIAKDMASDCKSLSIHKTGNFFFHKRLSHCNQPARFARTIWIKSFFNQRFRKEPYPDREIGSSYQNELTPLAFSEIPDEKLIAERFMDIIKQV